jgi:hypothetical protein
MNQRMLMFAIIVLCAPIGAWAQTSAADEERTFGTSSLVSHTLHATAFTGATPADNAAMASDASGDRYCLQTDRCVFRAPVLLPAGAVFVRLELEACDTSGSGQISVFLWQPTASNVALMAQTGSAPFEETPGCRTFASPNTAQTIDNLNNSYFVEVLALSQFSTVLTAATQFRAVRIFYRLQVSPAPATARFLDVPTNHAFFQFIEALAAAGITGGCNASPPRYCPDDPVTRGQMAVFLGRALGLHWAP